MEHITKLVRVPFFALVIFSGMAACSSGSAPDHAATASSRIQGGTADPGHLSVGLVWFQGGGFCTGTLITPDVVLTAGHCVQDPLDGFYTGEGTPTTDLSAPAPGLEPHPADKWIAHPSYSPGGGCPNTTFDIGLIHLVAPITGIAPTPFAIGSAPATDTTCDAVGYGTHTENGVTTYQQKRTGTEIVQSVAGTSVRVKVGTGLADHGDSGGPLICNGVIAGATSCHTDGDWPQHQIEFYARVDAAATWIQAQINAWSSDGGASDGGAADGGPADAGNDARDAGPSACSHPICQTGGTLAATCDPCASQICAVDSYCCSTAWDSTCVREVGTVCSVACN